MSFPRHREIYRSDGRGWRRGWGRGGGGLRRVWARAGRVVGGGGLWFGADLFRGCGGDLGLLPMTGLPVPLISTGGTSLLMSLTAIGLALGLSSHYERTLDEDSFRRY